MMWPERERAIIYLVAAIALIPSGFLIQYFFAISELVAIGDNSGISVHAAIIILVSWLMSTAVLRICYYKLFEERKARFSPLDVDLEACKEKYEFKDSADEATQTVPEIGCAFK